MLLLVGSPGRASSLHMRQTLVEPGRLGAVRAAFGTVHCFSTYLQGRLDTLSQTGRKHTFIFQKNLY